MLPSARTGERMAPTRTVLVRTVMGRTVMGRTVMTRLARERAAWPITQAPIRTELRTGGGSARDDTEPVGSSSCAMRA